MRELEIGEGRDEEFEQRNHVLRLQRVEQPAVARGDERNLGEAQRALVDREVRAPAHEDHDVAILDAAEHLASHVVGNLPAGVDFLDLRDKQVRLAPAPGVLGVSEGRQERVA